jgi:hypothetical protein
MPRQNSIGEFLCTIFGKFDYELESRLLKSENRFHAQSASTAPCCRHIN